MKKTTIMKSIILFAVLCGVVLCLCTCTKGKQAVSNTDAVSVLFDVTDPLISKPGTSIDNLFSISQDNSKGALFRLIPISDIAYTSVQEYSVQPQNALLQNPGQRKEEITTFFSDVNNSISAMKSATAGKPYSQIYPVVAREANYLASPSVSASHKTLLVYSNLYENSDSFSMYWKKDLNILYTNPQQVEAIFEKEVPLSNLSSLHVIFIYQATGLHDSERYNRIANIYKSLFESKGATVVISASANQ